MDDPVWDVAVFTKTRERLIAGEASRQLLLAVVGEAREHQLLSEEHFTVVDGTLIQAWTVAPHVSEYVHGNLGKNHLTEKERLDPQRPVSQRKRKLIERVFGWSKLNRPLRQIKLRGLQRVDWFYRLTIAAYNLVRMRKLIPISPLAA
jgi:hypothetical protein